MHSNDASPRHPIRVVAKRTGLTAPTIRAWERRYGAVQPVRSEGGQRLYSDADLERLDTLRELTEMGRPIGMVAALPHEAAAALLLEDRAALALTGRPQTDEERIALWVEEAYGHVQSFDDKALERILWRALMALDSSTFLEGLLVPLLERIGRGWRLGEVSIGQEHLCSEVVDRILAWMIDTSTSPDDGPRLVVATLQGERHALGARLVAATAGVEGCAVTYLGADLPPSAIVDSARRVGASAVAISFVIPEALESTRPALFELREQLAPSVDVLVGGSASGTLQARGVPAGVTVLEGLEDVREDCRRRRSTERTIRA